MAYVDWRMQGSLLVQCNCDFGCPCQFNSIPTHGDCRAFTFLQVDKGHFAKTSLDGVRWGAFFAWPKAIHEGNGEAMVVVDDKATAEQRAAIETIASGKETEPGSLITQVFSTTLTKLHPTQVKPIELRIDEKAGTASVRIAGLLDASAEPIKNPMTGAPHRVRVTLPTGFEYADAEYVAGTGKASGPIPLELNVSHAHLAKLNWCQNGVVRS